MRNYKASCSESPCVGMNRKICLSLFPHRPLPFHGLTFADGGWLLMQPQTFAGRYFSHASAEAGRKNGAWGEQLAVGGLKGTFQPGCVLLLAEREHRSPAVGGTGCKSTLPGTSSSVTHARIPAPALAEETTPVNHLHGEEVVAVGGNIKARSKRRRAKRSSPPFTSLASLSSQGFPGLWAQSCSTAGAGELRGQLMAEGGGGGAGQGKGGEQGRAKLL